MTHKILVGALLTLAIACGSDGGDDPLDPGPREGACAAATKVGAFEATLRDTFTGVQGKVEDAVTPYLVPDVIDVAGPCALVRPPSLFCAPTCDSGTTCDASGTCVPTAAGISVGTVTITGLKSVVEMSASPPVYFYTNLAPLDHPGFDESDEIVLIGTGDGVIEPFALGGRGIAPLVVPVFSVVLEQDQPTQLSWTPPGDADAGMMHVVLNIAQHGGTPGWIECEVPDTGSFELPVALTDQLLGSGFSGFPSLAMTRRSADSTETAVGCVEFSVQSSFVLDVEIPGLISCSDSDDCPPGEICQSDLTCG